MGSSMLISAPRIARMLVGAGVASKTAVQVTLPEA